MHQLMAIEINGLLQHIVDSGVFEIRVVPQEIVVCAYCYLDVLHSLALVYHLVQTTLWEFHLSYKGINIFIGKLFL